MNAIGLNPIKLDAIGLDPIRMNAIRLGVPEASSGSGRPYIDPELLSHVKMAISTWGKTNDDPDRAVLKDLSGNGNDMHLLNFGFAGNSGYGLYKVNFTSWNKYSNTIVTPNLITVNDAFTSNWLIYLKGAAIPSYKVKVSGIPKGGAYVRYLYVKEEGGSTIEFPIRTDGIYELPESKLGIATASVGFNLVGTDYNWTNIRIEQLPDFEGWLCTDGVDDIIESVKPVSEMLEGSNEITVVSIIHQISSMSNVAGARNNNIRASYNEICLRNIVGADGVGKTGIYGYTCANIRAIPTVPVTVNNILGDKNDYSSSGAKFFDIDLFSVQGFRDRDSGALYELSQVAYAGGFISNKALTADEINQIIAYFNLDRPGQIIKSQLYCNVKKQGITNDNHAEFNDQLIDFVGGHNIQLNNIGWEGESGIIDGALYLDGINDFGKVTGLPVLKDYTVVVDRELLSNKGSVLSKAKNIIDGAFVFESNGSTPKAYSFGGVTDIEINNNREISYQSKYIYNGQTINASTQEDFDMMWLAITRDGSTIYSKFALWSLMLFPYSLSEFLLERQLKKYKAGTLYPDMVEFRPIVKSNIPYSSISYSVNPGVYVAEGSMITITITLSNETDKLVGVSSNAIADISISGDNGTYEITGKVTKSPQKISIVISSYLTMLGNDTLILNETLIKNE